MVSGPLKTRTRQVFLLDLLVSHQARFVFVDYYDCVLVSFPLNHLLPTSPLLGAKGPAST